MRFPILALCLLTGLALAGPARALPAPVSQDEVRFLELASHLPAGADMPSMVAAAGAGLLGKPYAAHTLDVGETPDEPLVARLDAFDCVTFVEAALASARASVGGKPSFQRFADELERVRYRDGKRAGYVSRLHYFSEWIADNERRGLVQDLTPSLGGEPDRRPLRFMTSHREAYKKLKGDKAFQELLAIETHLASKPRYVLSRERLAAVLPLLQSGDIVGIATNIEGLDVVHTGLVYRRPDGSVHLLHAPEPGAAVQVSEKPLVDYVQAYKVYTGVLIARPLAP